jgi:hypothetical protein
VLLVLTEEALRAGVPVILIDVKSDLPNLLLAFPTFDAREFEPWVAGHAEPGKRVPTNLAEQLAEERRTQLTNWKITQAELEALRANSHIRVLIYHHQRRAPRR